MQEASTQTEDRLSGIGILVKHRISEHIQDEEGEMHLLLWEAGTPCEEDLTLPLRR